MRSVHPFSLSLAPLPMPREPAHDVDGRIDAFDSSPRGRGIELNEAGLYLCSVNMAIFSVGKYWSAREIVLFNGLFDIPAALFRLRENASLPDRSSPGAGPRNVRSQASAAWPKSRPLNTAVCLKG